MSPNRSPSSYNLSKDQQKKLATSVESAPILNILSKSKFICGSDWLEGAVKHVETCLYQLNETREISLILQALKFSNHVTICFDLNESDLTKVAHSESLGWYSETEKELLLGAKEMFSERAFFLGVFAHELVHWCLAVVFKNQCLPYYRGDPKRVMAREFGRIVEAVHKDFKNDATAFHPVILSVFSSYPPSNWHQELIVRVPHLIAACGIKKAKEILSRHESTKSLLEFYQSYILDEIDKFIANGDSEGSRETIYKLNNKLGLLQRYEEYDLQFSYEEDFHLQGSFSLLVYSSSHPYLTFMKIAWTLNCLEPNNKFCENNLFCLFDTFAENYNEICQAFCKLDGCKTLLVVCLGVNTGDRTIFLGWLEDLFLLASNPNKTVILIIESMLLSLTERPLATIPDVKSIVIDLTSSQMDIWDLAESSQRQVLEALVTFLGRQVKLQDLLGSDELELADGNLIERLLREEEITVGSRANSIDDRPPGFVTYFESLSPGRLIDLVDECIASGDMMIIVGKSENYPDQIKRKLCKLFEVYGIDQLFISPDDVFPKIDDITTITRRIWLLASRTDFEYSHIVDLLKRHEYLVCYFINIESKETIYSDLLYTPSLEFDRKLQLENSQAIDQCIGGSDLMDRLLSRDHQVIVLSDTAGSGKSQFLNSIQLIPNSTTHSWVVKFALKTCTSFIDRHSMGPDLKKEDALRFLCALGRIDDEFAKQFFSNKMEEGSKPPIILLLDGFDEVTSSDQNHASRNKDKIADLIIFLKRNTGVTTVVTTRPDSVTYLRKLSCPVFKFKSLNLLDSVNYVNKFCQTRIKLIGKIGARFNDVYRLNSAVNEGILNTPLHVTMISEILVETIRNGGFKTKIFLPDGKSEFMTVPVGPLYKEFINMKYRLYFKEKKNSTVDYRTKENCDSAFQRLALFSLYGNEEFSKDLFSNDSMFRHGSAGNIVLDTDNVNQYLDIGIISSVSRSRVDFIHRTFAEYFVSQLFISWAHQKALSRPVIFEVVYYEPFHHDLLLSFFNYFLMHSVSFPEDVLQIHGKTMESLGINDTIATVSRHLHWGHLNVVNHIVRCWTIMGKFHMLLSSPYMFNIASKIPESTSRRRLTMLFSEDFLKQRQTSSSSGMLDSFRICMHSFCVIYDRGIPEIVDIDFVRNNPEVQRHVTHLQVEDFEFCKYLLESGNVELLKGLLEVLVESGITTNKVGKLMHLAVVSGNKNIVEWMEENGGDIFSLTAKGASTAAFAIRMGKLEMAKWLEERGVRIECPANNWGSTVIHHAVMAYLFPAIRWLVRLGFDINSVDERGLTPLHLALQYWKPSEILENFCELGVDVHIRSDGGMNALHHAAAAETDSEVMEWLLEQGSSVDDPTNDGRTALFIALQHDNRATIAWLLNRTLNVQAVDSNGKGFLHYVAANVSRHEYLERMIEIYNVNLRDKDGLTAAHTLLDTIAKIPSTIDNYLDYHQPTKYGSIIQRMLTIMAKSDTNIAEELLTYAEEIHAKRNGKVLSLSYISLVCNIETYARTLRETGK